MTRMGPLPKVTPHKVAEFVHAYQTKHGYSPAVADIAAKFSISTSTAQYAITRAVIDGLVEKRAGGPNNHRRLAVTAEGMKQITNPMEQL